MSDLDRVIERVRKMLALANDKGASEGERDNALRMAHATLAKYNLDLSQVETKDDRTHKQFIFFGRPWARSICLSVSWLLFCEYLFVTATKSKETVHFFVGKEANAVSAGLLAEFLVSSVYREGQRERRIYAKGNAWFRSFATGAAASIHLRVHDIIKNSTASVPTYPPATPVATPRTSVVLASLYASERDANRGYIARIRGTDEPPRKRGGGKNNFVADGFTAGAEYGATVSLNQQIGEKK